MKYWLITTEFPPIHGGGISTYCWHTAKMLAEGGHQVTVFINDYSIEKTKTETPLNNVRLIRFNPSQVEIGKALGFDARLSLEFAQIIEEQIEKDGVPDVLETQDYLGIGYYILQKKHLLYPKFKELKIVLTMHAPNFLYLDYNQVPLYKFPEYWTGEMEKASIRMADLVISPSNYLIDQLSTRMNLSDKNPIRIFNPFRNDWTSGDIPQHEEGDIVFFGKLTPQKGCLEMLSYLKKMWDNGFNKVLSIIGGGDHFFYPVQEDMQVHVKRLYKKYIDQGLIRFEGNMPPERLKERLKKAHVILTPSIVDNLPYAVLEAMAMGKIVLASNNGGHTEILSHGESGFIFQHDVSGSFEEQLSYILNLNNDEIISVATKAQITVENTTNYRTVFRQKAEVIDSLIQDEKLSNTFSFIENIEKTTSLLEANISLESKKLSIVIPYYNMGEFIDDTLSSLQNITYSNAEIIVVNDGSTDPLSIEKLVGLESKYNCTVYHKENEGLPLTRNFGAKKCTGEFMAFLDADDTVSPDYYKRAIEVLKHYSNISFVGCWAQYFGESDSIWPTFNPEFPYLLAHNMINSSALIYKTQDFLHFGQNDPKMIYGMEDYESVIAMLKNGARGVVFPELWWQYRIRKDSMQQAFTKDKELYLYRTISNKHSDLFNKYGVEMANILNHNGSGTNYTNPTKVLDANINISERLILMIKKNRLMRSFAKKIYKKLYK